MIGTLSAHPDGFGFVRIEGRDKDLFLPHEEMRDLMDGDTIEVIASRRQGRECGKLVRLIEKAPDTVIGQLEHHGGIITVTPRNPRLHHAILIRERDTGNARDGDWVRVKIDRRSHPLRGRVVDRLEELDTATGLIDLVISEAGIVHDFPEAAIREAASLPARPRQADIAQRTDLRHLPMVTIDGADAKDFDDAICVQPRGDGFEAWIAIADVAHFVPPESALDRSARARGNSFYFPDRAIPMLPEALANNLCSLRPRVNRLVMAVRLRLDANGRVRSSRAYEAVIRSRARLTYDNVRDFLTGKKRLAARSEEVATTLRCADRLLTALQKQRHHRGAIDFNSVEMRFTLRNGRVKAIRPHTQDRAQQLIEELMLLANTAVANLLQEAKRTVIYRVHPEPKPREIEELNRFLAPFGLSIRTSKKGTLHPSEIQRLLEAAAGKGLEHILPRLVLRAMQQASYQADEAPHFGLAYTRYCHFTSPIRRYSDLLVHRELKALLHQKAPSHAKDIEKTCAHISAQERVQQRAEWDCEAMLAALFYRERIGETFTARISGMSRRRLFFTLEESGAEASLPIDQLAGSYTFDERNHLLRNRHYSQCLTLGDLMRVCIEGCDPVRGQIRVSIAEEA